MAVSDIGSYKRKMKVIFPDATLTHDSIVEGYNKLGFGYEEDVMKVNYTGHTLSANHFLKYAEIVGLKPSCTVLDIGVGTGLVGVEMMKLGYTNIDGTDPSSAMIREAKKKNVYSNLFQCTTGNGETMPFETNSYEAVVTCGTIQFLKCDGIYDIVRITKPGGLCVFVGRTNALHLKEDRPWFEEVLEEMKRDKKIRELEVAYPEEQFYGSHPSVVFAYQVL